jgi:hypothetical protein
MIVQNNVVELLEQFGTFFWVQFVDVFWKISNAEDALPSIERISNKINI